MVEVAEWLGGCASLVDGRGVIVMVVRERTWMVEEGWMYLGRRKLVNPFSIRTHFYLKFWV